MINNQLNEDIAQILENMGDLCYGQYHKEDGTITFDYGYYDSTIFLSINEILESDLLEDSTIEEVKLYIEKNK